MLFKMLQIRKIIRAEYIYFIDLFIISAKCLIAAEGKIIKILRSNYIKNQFKVYHKWWNDAVDKYKESRKNRSAGKMIVYSA